VLAGQLMLEHMLLGARDERWGRLSERLLAHTKTAAQRQTILDFVPVM